MSHCKYGDEANARADVKTLHEIMSRQGAEMLIDVVAEHVGSVALRWTLSAEERQRLHATFTSLMRDALAERL